MVTFKNDLLYLIALFFSIWFLGTAYLWIYWAALIISYPFGIASFLMWLYLKKDGKKRNKAILMILGIGLAISLSILFTVR